ncbi:MAG: hypothetical protein FWB85_01665 [Chitinispirillia bacterium]|nr:hypothetical protein [Chitinispirillia bacterium]MCL2241071.1 hypothetical protein [Chitinispirillia bacterium]
MKAEMYRQGMSRNDVKRKLLNLLEDRGMCDVSGLRIILRPGTDDAARLNRKSIEKMISDASIRASKNNGFPAGQHLAVVSDIIDLYEDSLKLVERQDRGGQPDVFIHRYGTPLHFNGAIAFITVKESTKYGKKVHDVELLEIGKLGGKLAGERITSPDRPSAPSFHIDNIRKLQSEVNSFD